MKLHVIALLAVTGSAVSADDLPFQAREVQKKLLRYEKAERNTLDKAINDKRKEVLSLLRKQRDIHKSKGDQRTAKFIVEAIEHLEQQIEQDRPGRRELLTFDKPYHYQHPWTGRCDNQRGEMIFKKDGSVAVTHITKNNDKKCWGANWKWEKRGNKIFIQADGTHGPIHITRGNRFNSITMKWTGKINNTVPGILK